MHLEKSGSCLPSVAALLILNLVLLVFEICWLALYGSKPSVSGVLEFFWPNALAATSALAAVGFRERSRFLPELYFLSLVMSGVVAFLSLVLAVAIGFPGPG